MARKVIILVGAPETAHLDWKESELLNNFLEPIAKFSQLEQSSETRILESELCSTPDTAVWRSLPLKKERLATGFSQTHNIDCEYHGNPTFFTTVSDPFDNTSMLTDEDQSRSILNQFFDHSLAIHDDLASSQLPAGTSSSEEYSVDTSGEMTTMLSTQNSSTSTRHQPPQVIESGHLSDLEDIPDAIYLQSVAPQTITVNLIVGVISIAEPRTVKTRWGTTRSLIELLVGDETKSGFSVTFWLSSDLDDASETLRKLRRQDIILLRNVALGVFMKKVHGHSLRKGLTKVDLLHRRKLDRTDQGGLYNMKDVSSKKAAHPQLVKTRKVRQWVLDFVSDGSTNLGKRRQNGRPLRSWDMPPADTQ
ncbi:hypothetical protein F5X96DRAFT_619720 [Biscogniauxia mediterranea]|nr:hypothetical protein F5X96DRAFT_619720 [Biscogniauxia mediterranea]